MCYYKEVEGSLKVLSYRGESEGRIVFMVGLRG